MRVPTEREGAFSAVGSVRPQKQQQRAAARSRSLSLSLALTVAQRVRLSAPLHITSWRPRLAHDTPSSSSFSSFSSSPLRPFQSLFLTPVHASRGLRRSRDPRRCTTGPVPTSLARPLLSIACTLYRAGRLALYERSSTRSSSLPAVLLLARAPSLKRASAQQLRHDGSEQ